MHVPDDVRECIHSRIYVGVLRAKRIFLSLLCLSVCLSLSLSLIVFVSCFFVILYLTATRQFFLIASVLDNLIALLLRISRTAALNVGDYKVLEIFVDSSHASVSCSFPFRPCMLG